MRSAPEPAKTCWRPTIGSTLALHEDHAPADRIMRAQADKRHSVGPGRAILFGSCGSARQPAWGRVNALVHACPRLFTLVHACASCSCLETSTEQEQTCQQTSFYIFNLQPKACSVNTDLFTQRGQGSQDRAAASAGVHTAPDGLPSTAAAAEQDRATSSIATFFDTDFLQCHTVCVRVCVRQLQRVLSATQGRPD